MRHFEVRYAFELAEDITIPAGCVLKFEGGSIGGAYTLTLYNTIICGTPTINVVLDGTCANDKVYAEWFGIKSGNDNIAGNNIAFTNYIIPSMENIGGCLAIKNTSSVYFSTPLSFSGKYDIDFSGVLYYDGTGNFNSTAITIGSNERVQKKRIYINDLISTVTSYTSVTPIPDYVGILLKNMKICDIKIGRVANFAFNVRCYAHGTAFASNQLNIVALSGYYHIALHLLADDIDSENQGWLNENMFYMGLITPYNNNPYYSSDNCIGIYLENNSSFSANSNNFIKPNLEGNNIGFKIKDGNQNVVFMARAEFLGKAIELEGNCYNNSFISSSVFSTTGEHESKGRCNIVTTVNEMARCAMHNYGGPISRINGNPVNIDWFGSMYGYFFDITAQDNEIFLSSNANVRYYLSVYDDDHKIVPLTEAVSYYVSGGAWVIDGNTLKNAASGSPRYVKLNYTNVKHVFIGVMAYTISNINELDVYGYGINYVPTFRREGKCNAKVSSVFTSFYAANYDQALAGFTVKICDNIDLDGGPTITLSNNMTLDFRGGKIINGTIKLNSAKILPSYNALVDDNNTLTVQGNPAAGTLYWQSGRPTWADGTGGWVYADGTPVV